MIGYFFITFGVSLAVSGVVSSVFHRQSREPGHAHWVGALVFSLLVAAGLTLLNVGR